MAALAGGSEPLSSTSSSAARGTRLGGCSLLGCSSVLVRTLDDCVGCAPSGASSTRSRDPSPSAGAAASRAAENSSWRDARTAAPRTPPIPVSGACSASVRALGLPVSAPRSLSPSARTSGVRRDAMVSASDTSKLASNTSLLTCSTSVMSKYTPNSEQNGAVQRRAPVGPRCSSKLESFNLDLLVLRH